MTNTNDYFLMGRVLAKAMGYIDYPDIQTPIRMNQKPSTSVTVTQAKTGTLYPAPVLNLPQTVQSCKKQSIKKPDDPRNSPNSRDYTPYITDYQLYLIKSEPA